MIVSALPVVLPPEAGGPERRPAETPYPTVKPLTVTWATQTPSSSVIRTS